VSNLLACGYVSPVRLPSPPPPRDLDCPCVAARAGDAAVSMAGWYRVRCACVSQALHAHSTLGYCISRGQHLLRDTQEISTFWGIQEINTIKEEIFSEVWEKSAVVDSAEPNS
jgi:hypothetical protein